MTMGNVVTFLLATVIIGYGMYMLIKKIWKQSKGDCSSCSSCLNSDSCPIKDNIDNDIDPPKNKC